jgi:hypothetical protein
MIAIANGRKTGRKKYKGGVLGRMRLRDGKVKQQNEPSILYMNS